MAMTPEERRAKDAERKRLKRAADRAAKAPATAPAADAPASTVMHDDVELALGAAKWLAESDAASKRQALMLADDVDWCTANGDRAGARAAHRALSRVLNDLGMTPSVRLQRELRSRKATPEVPDGSSSTAPEASNVSQFKRPPKRRA